MYSANIHVDLKTAIYNLYIMHKWHVNVIPPHANNDYRILIAVIENSVFEPGFNEWFLDLHQIFIRDVKVSFLLNDDGNRLIQTPREIYLD